MQGIGGVGRERILVYDLLYLLKVPRQPELVIDRNIVRSLIVTKSLGAGVHRPWEIIYTVTVRFIKPIDTLNSFDNVGIAGK